MTDAPMVAKQPRRGKPRLFFRFLSEFQRVWIYGAAAIFSVGLEGLGIVRFGYAVGLLAYLYALTSLFRGVFARLFALHPKDGITLILSFCVAFFVSSLHVAVAMVWFPFSYTVVLGALGTAFLTSVAIGMLTLWRPPTSLSTPIPGTIIEPPFASRALWLHLFWLGLITTLFFFFRHTAAMGTLVTPWQSLPRSFAVMVALLAGWLVFLFATRTKTKQLLAALVGFSLVIGLLIPLSHQLPWGADGWRHIGTMRGFLAGDVYRPVLFGSEATTRPVGPIAVPDALLQPHKYAYGQLWGSVLVLFGTNLWSLEGIMRFFLPLLWSITTPILFFRVGGLLFRSWRRGLVFSFLCLFPFALRAGGAFTLPVGLGFWNTLVVFWLFLEHVRRPSLASAVLLGCSFVASVFFYPVATILVLSMTGTWWFVRLVRREVKNRVLLGFLAVILALGSVCLFPLVELATKTSTWPVARDTYTIIDQFSELAYRMTGASVFSPRAPEDIGPGNSFFNAPPAHVPLPHLVERLRPLSFFISLILWFLFLGGMTVSMRVERKKSWWTLWGVALSIVGGYGVSWFFLSGDHSLVRRLDMWLAFFVLLFSMRLMTMRFVPTWSVRMRQLARVKGALVAVVVMGFGLLLGPDSQTMDVSTYEAFAGFTSAPRGTPTCVLADTWPLLALEAQSYGRVIGGGFPMDYQFAQPERTVLWREAVVNPRASIIHLALRYTGTSTCVLVLPTTVSSSTIDTWTALAGEDPTTRGTMLFWTLTQAQIDAVLLEQKAN